MSARRTIGEILLRSGRVTEEDVSRALDHQRREGGYFGEALVTLGIVTPDELEWSIASQFDLPYVFPDAESIDPEAAALVTPEWALAHLALPIMRTENTLKVVIDSPLKSEVLEDLQARTDLHVELALASPERIRELVRQVHARQAERPDPGRETSVKLEQALALAVAAGSRRFGISARGARSWFWYDDAGTVLRRPLDGPWKSTLDQLVTPSPSGHLQGPGPSRSEVELSREGTVRALTLDYLASEAGQEYVFRPVRQVSRLEERFPPPPSGVLSEIRLLARSGSARFVVGGRPEGLIREMTPHLPALLLDPSWRSIHVGAEGQSPPADVLSVIVPAEGEAWRLEIERLRSFQFDAVSVDPTGAGIEWALGSLDIAPVVFVLWHGGLDAKTAHEAGLRWRLDAERAHGRRLEWSLEPLHV